MKRLVEAVKDWLRYDDIVAEHGYDGGENDANWDNAKRDMAKLVNEPLKVYETVIVRDIEDWGLNVSTEVFCDHAAARKHILGEIKSAMKGFYMSEPGPEEMANYEYMLLNDKSFVIEHDDSSVTFEINVKEIRDGKQEA